MSTAIIEKKKRAGAINNVLIKWTEKKEKKIQSMNFEHFDKIALTDLFQASEKHGITLEKINIGQCNPKLTKSQKKDLEISINELNKEFGTKVKMTSGDSTNRRLAFFKQKTQPLEVKAEAKSSLKSKK